MRITKNIFLYKYISMRKWSNCERVVTIVQINFSYRESGFAVFYTLYIYVLLNIYIIFSYPLKRTFGCIYYYILLTIYSTK